MRRTETDMPSALLWQNRLRNPPPPRAPKQLCECQQRVLPSSSTAALGLVVVRCPHPVLRTFRCPAATALRAHSADVGSHLGFAISYANSSTHPCASLSQQLPAVSSLQLPFQGWSHVFGLCGEPGVPLPTSAVSHKSFYLFCA